MTVLTDPQDFKEIYKYNNTIITIKGWVYHLRIGGHLNLLFLYIGNACSSKNVQVVINIANHPEQTLKDIVYQSSVEVTGKVVPSPGKYQDYEIQATDIKLIGKCDINSYPFKKSRVGYDVDYQRSHQHLRIKTTDFAKTMYTRSTLFTSTVNFFQDRHFVWIQTPILTNQPGDLKVLTDKDNRSMGYLTHSSQFHLETFIQFGKVFSLGPCFHSEGTTLETWKLNVEMAFTSLDDFLQIIMEYFHYVTSKINSDDKPSFIKGVHHTLIKEEEEVTEPTLCVSESEHQVKLLLPKVGQVLIGGERLSQTTPTEGLPQWYLESTQQYGGGVPHTGFSLDLDKFSCFAMNTELLDSIAFPVLFNRNLKY